MREVGNIATGNETKDWFSGTEDIANNLRGIITRLCSY
jgi:hypothetical protein